MEQEEIHEIVNTAVQKERRLVTVEMQVQLLEKAHQELKETMTTGFDSIKELAKWGFGIATGVLTLVFSAIEILTKVMGHG